MRPDLTRGKGTEAPPASGMRGRAFLLRVGFLGARGLLPKERASPSFPRVCVSPSHTDVRARVTFLLPVPMWVLAGFASLGGFRPALLSVSVPHTQSKNFEMPLGSLRPSSPSGPRGVKMPTRPEARAPRGPPQDLTRLGVGGGRNTRTGTHLASVPGKELGDVRPHSLCRPF